MNSLAKAVEEGNVSNEADTTIRSAQIAELKSRRAIHFHSRGLFSTF
jgi:hypothetical protein